MVASRLGADNLVLEFGSTRFEVTADHGARISSLRYRGHELLWLRGAPSFADATGSTFWPSPQRWTWPPPAELDREPYRPSLVARDTLKLVSRPHAATQLQVEKTFTANPAREAVDVSYAMTNVGAQPVSWAPWEITRVPPAGVAFWPTGGPPFGDAPLLSRCSLGHTWCEPSSTRGEGKLFADGGGGYLAYVEGGYLLVKSFADITPSQAAPGEAEIEVYINPDHSYVEVEQQGAYTRIDPGATVSWRVTWFARQLPGGVAALGDADLVAFVAETLQ
jgi:hypothetical protein